MIKEEIKKGEEEFEEKFKDMLNLVETQTGYSERENVKSFFSDYTTALLQAVVEEVDGRKKKLPHFECREGKKEACQVCEGYEFYNEGLTQLSSHLKDIISQQEKHE